MHDSNSEKNSSSCISEAHLSINKAFVESVPDPMCMLDLDCRILMVNDGAMKLFGPQPETFFIGKSILDFIIPDNHPQIMEGINRCLSTNLANQSEYMIRTQDGTLLPIKTTSFILSNNSKKPIALLSLVKDGSNAESIETIIGEGDSRAQLYLDLLSHDISNKLQIMMSSAELLRDITNGSCESRLIQNIIESVLSCKRIIYGTEILESYQDQPMKAQDLDVIVRTSLMELIRSCEDIIVHANIQICDATVICDDYIINLVSNILENARVHNTSDDKQVWVTLREEDDGYLLSICDNGPGISSDIITNGPCVEERSSGIGLYICHALIKKYQGWIQIADRIKDHPELGTQVLLWFPKLKEPLQ